MQTLTISASVRPGRVAVLCDIADPEWMYSCRYILETFSTIWCDHSNIVIPTDGKTIRPLFGKSSSNSTRTTSARPTLRHLEERDPAAFEAKIAEQLATWGEDYESNGNVWSAARLQGKSVGREDKSAQMYVFGLWLETSSPGHDELRACLSF
jgi:hypothetical protein